MTRILYEIAAAILLVLAAAWWGRSGAERACDLEAAEARGAAAERHAQRLQRATDASLSVAGVSLELNTTLHVTRTRTRTIVDEVARDVSASTHLADCPVPDRTRELRGEQVRESRRVAGADDRAMQR